MCSRRTRQSLPPEDRDDADELVGVCEEREGGHGDFALDPVSARDPKAFVRRAALVEGDPRRSAFRRNRLQIGCSGREACHPLVERHLARLRERQAEDFLRRLVVVGEPSFVVGDQHRRGEVRRELAGQDENEVLRPALLHRASVRRWIRARARAAPRSSPRGSLLSSPAAHRPRGGRFAALRSGS